MQNLLPNELINYTFGFFNELSHIKNASEVCKKWNAVALKHPIYINAHTEYRLTQAVLKGDAKVVEEILKKEPKRIETLFNEYYCDYHARMPDLFNNEIPRSLKIIKPSLLHVTFMKFIEIQEAKDLKKLAKENASQQYLDAFLILLKFTTEDTFNYLAETFYAKANELGSSKHSISFLGLVEEIQYYPPIYPIYFYVKIASAEMAIKKNDLTKFYENIENLVDRIAATRPTNKEKKKILLLECLNNLKNKKGLTGPLPDELNIAPLLSQNSKISGFLAQNLSNQNQSNNRENIITKFMKRFR